MSTEKQRAARAKQKAEQRSGSVPWALARPAATLPTCSWWASLKSRGAFMRRASAEATRMRYSRFHDYVLGHGIEQRDGSQVRSSPEDLADVAVVLAARGRGDA